MSTVKYQSWEAARRVFYSEFESKVRKYAPLELLAQLDQMSSSMDEFSGFQNTWATLAPWTISGIARQSILSSNRAGGQHIDRPAFRRIANLFDQIDVRPNGKFETYTFLAGKAHEQFSYQLSGKEDLSRTLSVLLDTPVNFKGQKSKADLDALLGAPLDDLATSTFVLYGMARAAKGVITRNAIEQLVQETPDKLPSFASIWATLERLSATIDGFARSLLQLTFKLV